MTDKPMKNFNEFEIVVDRPINESDVDAETVVIFPDGYRVRFWRQGLSDAEYIRRAKMIRDSE